MTDYIQNPFNSHDDRNEDDGYQFDPTLPSLMQSFSGTEIPDPDYCTFVSGTRHPSLADLSDLNREPERGSIILPKTIPLVSQDLQNPLSREPVYGSDLVFQSCQRAAHIVVIGPTGSGKNTTVIDPLRFSAIAAPMHTVVSFSLKASDFGPVKILCDQVGKRLIVVNLNDAWRSAGWNALATKEPDIAIDRIRRFSDSVKNPASSDSEFWTQWIRTALSGAWQEGYQSFPAIYELFSLPAAELQSELRNHDNPSSRQLAEFLAGGSHNADTVLASIVGAMSTFLSENVMRVMSKDELRIDKVFDEPVCLHIEMPETSLETQRVLYQMLATSVVDALIENAEKASSSPIPATIFFDDMPSLGCILRPERMLTMRSRGIGVVAGVQGISSLELAYGQTSRALIDNFHTKIILPGGPASDADFFSCASGEQMVTLPTYSGQNSSFVSRPLISSADIRTPNYSHPLFGQPATLMIGPTTFQAYLQRTYEHPWMASLLRCSSGISGRERLRNRRLALPRRNRHSSPATAINEVSFSDAKGWSASRLKGHLTEVKNKLNWDNTSGSARNWWQGFEDENKHRLALVLRLAEELANRKATIKEFFLAYVYSNTDNIQANLHYLDYTRLKKAEAAKKRQSQSEEKGLVSSDATSGAAVVLTSYRDRKLAVIKAVKKLTGLSLMETKRLVENAPTIIGRCDSEAQAKRAIDEIRGAGGIAKLG